VSIVDWDRVLGGYGPYVLETLVETRDTFFSVSVQTCLGPIQLLLQWVLEIFPGVQQPGIGFEHPPLSTAEVKNW